MSTRVAKRERVTTDAAVSCRQTCLLVHPLPSIADESFLSVLFHNCVARSMFFGFGRRRFAIAELNSDEAVGNVLTALSTTEDEAEEAEEEKQSRLPPSSALAEVDDATLENMTLSDMFTPALRPPQHPSSASTTSAAAEQSSAAAPLDMRHLRHLVWRNGYRVEVQVSPVSIEDFFRSGGVVPQHQEATRKKRDKKQQSSLSLCDGEAVEGETEMALETSGRTGNTGSSASGPPRQVEERVKKLKLFPSDCCQKCGSPDHFTRRCDGSGPAAAAVAVSRANEELAQKDASPTEVQATTFSAVPPPSRPPATAPAFQRVSKDQCKFCGSEHHLSRHCPNK